MPVQKIGEAKVRLFQKKLLEWAAAHPRPLPWKNTRDPYIIWLSEIILQQTRVEQGSPYFLKFAEKYPTVQHLAAAPEDELMKMWEGLGYYSRARNLHAAAKKIVEDGGKFPDTFEAIKKMKGVGEYTASAIASFAFDLPFAVVDGNVFRVLSRIFGVATPIDSTEGKKEFSKLADLLLDRTVPGKYNQAMMDFGATHCTPANPKCSQCTFSADCVAFQTGRVSDLPVKGKKLEKRLRYFNFLKIKTGEKVVIRKRAEKDIWRNLYEFPLIETDNPAEKPEDLKTGKGSGGLFLKEIPDSVFQHPKRYQQLLTHQKIIATFWEWEAGEGFHIDFSGFLTVDQKLLGKFAFPKVIDLYLKDKILPLKLF